MNTLPSWDQLKQQVITTKKGSEMIIEENLREGGGGPPHTDAKLRLFGTNTEPRVTLYRDSAAWCPYCQVF